MLRAFDSEFAKIKASQKDRQEMTNTKLPSRFDIPELIQWFCNDLMSLGTAIGELRDTILTLK